jgi:hypothetical protein
MDVITSYFIVSLTPLSAWMGGFGACPKHHYNWLLGYFFNKLKRLFIMYHYRNEFRRDQHMCRNHNSRLIR